MSFRIVTENTSDLPKEYCEKNDVTIMNLDCFIDGVSCLDKPYQEVYKLMREGRMPQTSMLTSFQIREVVEPMLKNGEKVLYIAFSSALSGTCAAGLSLSEELKDVYPNQFYVVDSLSASLGEGMVVDMAVQLRNENKDIEEVYKYVDENKQQVCHYFTVDSLFHLNRGGRIKKLTAIIGSLLQMKPVLHTSSEGKLVPIEKVMGRKKALNQLVNRMYAKCESKELDQVFITHGDNEKDANFVKSLIEQKFKVKTFIINAINTIIGAHSGPDAIAIFFRAKNRELTV